MKLITSDFQDNSIEDKDSNNNLLRKINKEKTKMS